MNESRCAPDLVAFVLSVVDQWRFDHIDPADGSRDDREPLVMHPFAWKRRGGGEQGAPKYGRRTCHQIASQEHVEGLAAVNPCPLEWANFQCMKKGVAQWFAQAIDKARIGMQQQQIGLGLELGGHLGQSVGLPEVILIGECNEVAGARPRSLLEVFGDAQWRVVAQNPQSDVESGLLAHALRHRGLGQRDRVVARRVVR